MRCRFDGESDLTPEQRQVFRDNFVKDCLKKDEKIERNILIIIAILVIGALSIMCEDCTVAVVMIPLLIITLFTEVE